MTNDELIAGLLKATFISKDWCWKILRALGAELEISSSASNQGGVSITMANWMQDTHITDPRDVLSIGLLAIYAQENGYFWTLRCEKKQTYTAIIYNNNEDYYIEVGKQPELTFAAALISARKETQ